MKPLSVMIIAGEISGDIHAANLLKELKIQNPGCSAFGIGGDALQDQGAELLYHTRDMAVMGISEVLQRIRFFRRVLNQMTELAAERRPDVLITVDYPGFNLRLAARVRALGIRTVQYISPKVWAWNARRIPKVAAACDRLITIFPFETRCYSQTDLDVVYVGNPLVDDAQRQHTLPAQPLPWQGEPRLAILPGSRRHEIARLLPLLVNTLERIKETFPQCSAIIPAPTPEVAELVEHALAQHSRRATQQFPVVVGEAREVLRQADAALVASGTATLEASLMRCPTVITYKVSPLTWILGRIFVKLKFVGLVNIIANRAVCPELLQRNATVENLTRAILPLLEATEQRRHMLDGIDSVNQTLGDPGASARAAQAVLELCQSPRTDTP